PCAWLRVRHGDRSPQRSRGSPAANCCLKGRRSFTIEFQSGDVYRRSSTMRSDIVPGGAFPDYQLPDHTGNLRKLSELQGDDPLILTLARGHYCPKEHQQHLELAAFYPKI